MKAPWIKHALIGINENTAQQALNDWGLPGNFLQTIAQQPTPVAQNFSLSVGVWAACAQAAFTPIQINEVDQTQFTTVPHEVTLEENDPVAYTLAEVFLSNNQRSIYEALLLLDQKNMKLPFHMLASALDIGRRNTDIRPIVLKAIGLRGAWLARLNPQWKYAATSLEEELEKHDERLWFEGNLAQREAFFIHSREKDPSYARTLLEGELRNLPAKERLTFVSLLEPQLNDEDEPLLTTLLSDRSGEVKDKRAELLARLPNSSYAQQIKAIMQTLVEKKKGFLGTSWSCEAPSDFLPEWKKLGFNDKPPAYYRLGGERSWWLFQIAAKTPLKWWCDHMSMSVEELAQWSKKTNWTEVLRHAWQASISATDIDWVQALLENPKLLETKSYSNLFTQLKTIFNRLPNDTRIGLINKMQKSVVQNKDLMHMIYEGLPLYATLPLQFSQSVLENLYTDYNSSKFKNDYQKSYIYKNIVWAIDPQALFMWKKPEKKLTAETANDIQWMQELDDAIVMRQKLHTQMNALSSNT